MPGQRLQKNATPMRKMHTWRGCCHELLEFSLGPNRAPISQPERQFFSNTPTPGGFRLGDAVLGMEHLYHPLNTRIAGREAQQTTMVSN